MSDTIELLKVSLDTDKLAQDLEKTKVQILGLKQSTSELKAENDKLLASNKQLASEGKKNTAQYKDNETAINNNKKAIKSNNEETKKLTQTQKAQQKVADDWKTANEKNGQSINAMRKQLTLVTKEWTKLTAEEIKNTKKGQELNKAKTDLTKNLKELESATGDNRRNVGNYSESFGVLGNSMQSAGGKAGQLAGIIPKLGSTFKALWTVMKANPVILILSIIAGLIAMIGKVLSKFQPLIDWISDKLAYVSGLVDGFVTAMRSVGDVISAVFSGDFEEASRLMGELGANITATAEATEALNKAMRESERLKKLNDATTAEVTNTMAKLMAVYKDEGKSVEERTVAFEKYWKMKKEQAMDDYNAEKMVTEKIIALYNAKYKTLLKEKGIRLDNAVSIKKALDEGILNEEEYDEAIIAVTKSTELLGKVEETEAMKARQFNTIRTKGLSELLSLQKAQLNYYKVKNQTAIESGTKLNDELLKMEQDRLDKIKNKELSIIQKNLQAELDAYGTNDNKVKEARLKSATERLKILQGYNKDVQALDKAYSDQKLSDEASSLKLYLAQNKEYLKAVTVDSEIELQKRLTKLQEIQQKELDLIEQKYTSGIISDNDYQIALIQNQEKYDNLKMQNEKAYNDKIKKEKEEAHKKIIKSLNDITLSEDSKNLKQINAFYDAKQEALLTNLKNGLLSEQEYKEMSLQNEADKQEAISELRKQGVEDLKQTLSIASEATQIYTDAVNAYAEKELQIAESVYNGKKSALDKQLKSGKISQDEYNKQLLIAEIKKVKKENEINKKKFESDKAVKLAQAILATALGVANSLSTGMPWGAILAGLSAVAGAVQIATISNTEFTPAELPKMARGGAIQIGGKPHSQGGTQFYGSDGTAFEAEEDENLYILNKRASSKINALSRVNEMFGGVSFGTKKTFLQSGGGVQRSASITNSNEQLTASFTEAIDKMPSPIVAVDEINDVSGHIVSVEENLTF